MSKLQEKHILEGTVYLQSKKTFFNRFPYLMPGFVLSILISFIRLIYAKKSHQNAT